VGGRLETADRWGWRDRERVGAGKRTVPTALAHGAEGEGVSAQACADRWDPPVRRRGRAVAGARGGWAKWADLG
jgi:hypothetical protein